ncbi:aminopeptidase N [Fodinicola acaciae]|uniref:aminopeptidase N n=1 Tax=Fodinicola acaciae TaxID=2681555 RepID=UPI0013D1D923|nr:aminopeptidase N [Fodinicola acaciae]
MPGSNLTRVEARERADLLAVDSYQVWLDLTDGAGNPGQRTFRTRTEVRFTARTSGASTFVDLLADKIHSATLNGQPVDVSAYDPQDGIQLTGLRADNVLVVDADGLYTNTGEGLHRFVDPVDDEVYLYSQFETADAKRVYTCFDQPDLKATFSFHVTAPAHWRVFSNAAPESSEPTAEGAQTVHFATTKRISPYITAIVAGPYEGVTDTHDGIDLGIFCRASLVQYLDGDNLLDLTRKGFDWYHEQFGFRYPFGKYDQIFCPEYNAGAMENAGCVTILEDYVFRSKPVEYTLERRCTTVLHEMAHMWFGDLVTMRWWDDLWLNESFAELASALCQSEIDSPFAEVAWTSFENIEKSWGYRQDQLPSTHPIASDIPDVQAVEVNFDGITYAKGAAVLRQLMAYVGREEFMRGMRTYFERHAFGNATLADLLGVLSEVSGRELDTWSQKWLQTSQVNIIRPEIELEADGTYRAVSLRQEAPADHPTLRPHRLALGLYDFADGDFQLREQVELDVDGELTPVPQLAGKTQPDLLLVNDGGLTYTKIRLDERSLRTVVEHIAEMSDPLARSLCWQAAWDMVRDAEMPARDYATMVLRGMPTETVSSLILDGIRNINLVLGQYCEPAWSLQGWKALNRTALATMRSVEPGSDAQLQWTRVADDTSWAGGEESIAEIRGLLDGTVTVEGLKVDPDLRWHLLQGLASAGAVGEAEIAAELERDATATGQRKAANARASIPTAEAKAAAWRLAVEEDGAPNAIIEATIMGFWHPGQLELLRPYADRYFAEVADVWRRRTSETAQNVVIGMFPRLLVEQSTLDAADAFLADPELPPALRRLVAEQRDGVRRALAARERDGKAG